MNKHIGRFGEVTWTCKDCEPGYQARLAKEELALQRMRAARPRPDIIETILWGN